MPTYNARSEKSLVTLFPTLEPVQSLEGAYSAELPGPRSLLIFKRLFLFASGLPGWLGKLFMSTQAYNMLERDGRVVHGPIMNLAVVPSPVDGKPCLTATYDARAPFMWRHCSDEFRWIDKNTLLGMSTFDLPFLRTVPVVFILHRDRSKDGILN